MLGGLARNLRADGFQLTTQRNATQRNPRGKEAVTGHPWTVSGASAGHLDVDEALEAAAMQTGAGEELWVGGWRRQRSQEKSRWRWLFGMMRGRGRVRVRVRGRKADEMLDRDDDSDSDGRHGSCSVLSRRLPSRCKPWRHQKLPQITPDNVTLR